MAPRTFLLAVATGLVSLTFANPAVAGDSSSGIRMAVTVDGARLSEPVRIDPERPVIVEITVQNRTASAVLVRSVRLAGSVMGLRFFDVGTSVAAGVPANQMRTWRVEVDVADLGGQATGLLPLEVAVVGQDRRVLASVDGTADVRGSLTSTYGLFGLGILVATALLWASALLALARHRLPANRWKRAIRFVPGGVGIGLVAAVTLSVVRVTAPSARAEIGFSLAASALAFLLGYLTPPPDDTPAGAGASGSAGPVAVAPAPAAAVPAQPGPDSAATSDPRTVSAFPGAPNPLGDPLVNPSKSPYSTPEDRGL